MTSDFIYRLTSLNERPASLITDDLIDEAFSEMINADVFSWAHQHTHTHRNLLAYHHEFIIPGVVAAVGDVTAEI